MNTGPRKSGAAPILIWSVVWALADVAGAFFIKGNPANYWIMAAVNVVGIFVFLLLNSRRNAVSAR
jgi:hypothetical protein